MNVCLGFVISHHMSKTSCDEYRISVSGSLFKANLGLIFAEESQNTLETHIINICFSPCRK